MDITGNINFSAVVDSVETISDIYYDSNVVVHPDAHPLRSNGRGFRGRIHVKDSYGPGSRTSWTGRHGRYACWHAYRDVMALIFAVHPDVTIRTAIATYKGLSGFHDTYPATAWHNIGSVMAPAYMPDLCDCPAHYR